MLLSNKKITARTYNLRTRDVESTVDPARRISREETSARPPLYSDVAASRPPSPGREVDDGLVEQDEHPSDDVDSEGVYGYSRTDLAAAQAAQAAQSADSRGDVEVIRNDTSHEDHRNDDPENPDDRPWTTVGRRRAISLDSIPRGPVSNRGKDTLAVPLTKEQTQTVNAAVSSMNAEQSNLLKKRLQNVSSSRDKSASRGEGPSEPKGKGIDPREWGNVDQRDLDVDAQAAAFKYFSARGEVPSGADRRPSKREGRRRHSRSRKKHHTQPAESRPAAQIAKNSYLGMALRHVGRHGPADGDGDGSPSSSETSDASESDSTSSDEESEDNSYSRRDRTPKSPYPRKRRDNKHGRNKKRRRSSTPSSGASRPTLKPIPPLEYDGRPDARSYHRFVRESEAYLRDGKVRGRRKVFLLSYYLTGRAYDFYTQKVSLDEESWSLRDFYAELFNYCFPVDFRMQMRKTLARCYQNELTVSEYTHQLHELFNMIGDIPDRDKVLKFWNGTRPVIQKGLWRDNLNPEISTWDQVVSQAEIIEISENVADRRDRAKVGSSQPAAGGSTDRPARSKGNSNQQARSARAVTFDSPRRRHGHDRQRSRVPNQQSREGSQAASTSRHPSTPGSDRRDTRGTSSKGKFQTPSGSSYKKEPSRTPRRSEKELAEFRASGRCFVCGGEGHISRNCPENQTVHASGSRPPGKAAFSIEPVASGLDDSVEVLDSLPLGAIDFEDDEAVMPVSYWPIEEWGEHYPYWDEPHILAREEIGDCYGMVADAILTTDQPYPGDDLFDVDQIRPEMRFSIFFQEKTQDYLIKDQLVDAEVVIARSLLEKPQFDISRWYAARRIEALNLDMKPSHRGAMGYAVSWVATKLLMDGISSSYPCTRPELNPRSRFVVYPLRPGRDEYTIIDDDLEIIVHVPKILLEDQSFDLVAWYTIQIDARRMFKHWYTKYHAQKYRVDHMIEPAPEWPEWEDLDIEFESPEQPEDDPRYDDLPGLTPVSDSEDGCSDGILEFDQEGPEDKEDDMPGLIPVSDSEAGDSDDEDEESSSSDDEDDHTTKDNGPPKEFTNITSVPTMLLTQLEAVLDRCQPFPGDGIAVDPTYSVGDRRFCIDMRDARTVEIYDRVQGFDTHIRLHLLGWPSFSLGKWYAERCAETVGFPEPWKRAHEWIGTRIWEDTTIEGLPSALEDLTDVEMADAVDLGGVQVDRNRFPALQRNAAHIKGGHRVLPKPLVVKVMVNGHPARALLDSGSLGDFISSTLADQLGVKRKQLDTPLSLQLAVQGSRSKVNSVATVRLEYQTINEDRTLDIININSYDLILGTPWLFQHQVCVGFNPARVVIGSDESQPLNMTAETKLMVNAMTPEDRDLDKAREELRQYASPLCKDVSETNLPPFRAINHTIPLVDVSKTYPWRPSRCPEAFRSQWSEKRDAYLKSGRWKITSAGNTVPMLLIPKPNTSPPELRTVVDLRERNKNTQKMTSPLPDIEGMLRRTAKRKYRTTLDMKSAYEQIRIVPEHVSRSTVTTPDGNMVSQVIQIGDCNAPATYQALMNHLFSSYIGRFMDIYLDDIVIYSDNLADHVDHVKLVIDILKREKLYLSRSKLHFIEPELKLLGRIIDDQGIRMDSEKVDSVLDWKIPTNRDLLRGFIGSVGYLADDIPNVRIPMGILSAVTGDTVPFRWGYTEQRAFDEVKSLVHHSREHRRVPLDYSEGAPPIWMITDGCSTGISGVISQGADWKTAKIAAFYSAKLNSAQQNYPVHEIELLAGVETMLRHADILQGVSFQWLTDHKGLTYLLNQKNLSGRQARWLEKMSTFVFKVVYIPGSENVVADALSRLYSNDSPGTQRARSEFTYYDVVDDDTSKVDDSLPVLAGIEAKIATRRGTRERRLTEKAATARVESSRNFASRVRDHFVLRGPVEQKEGGSTESSGKNPVTANDAPETSGSTASDAPETQVPVEDFENGHMAEEPVPEPNLTTTDDASTSLLSRSNLGIDLLKELRGKYGTDPFFRSILEKPTEFRNFEVSEELVYLKDDHRRLLCIPKILVQGRSAREVVISEAHSMLAHLGASKNLDYLREYVWWKDMVSDVKAFCETCHTCKTSKPSNQKPYGLLNPLAVPNRPWESIGIDFVGPLPESGNRDGLYDSITVVICLLTSMVHLIPSRTNYNATQLAELMFENIYKLHGLPDHIISDRDVLFTSTFWNQLHRLIGTKLRMSSAYHPQSDGSTERANRTVTQMLRQCIHPNQKDWVSKLPAIEFAINSARSESTGFAPFFLNFGRMPRAMIWGSASETEFPSVREFAVQKKLSLMSAHDSILAARVKQTRNSNQKRQTIPFKTGDLAYLSTKNISFPKGLARKLLPKFIGPYKILRDFGNASFLLELPSHLKRRGVHDVFHSSLLRIHLPSDDRLFPGRMDTQLGMDSQTDGEWAVDRILSHAGSRTDSVFEIKWRSGDVTWLPYYQITHLQALTDYLELLGVDNISKLAAGKGTPPPDDPQIFLGAITFYQNSPSCLFLPTLLTPLRYLNQLIKSMATRFYITTILSFNSPTLDFDTMPTMPGRYGVDHPSFSRLSPTEYLMRVPGAYTTAIVHVGQIALFLQFDEEVRLRRGVKGLESVPVGYAEFAEAWNDGAGVRDPRRISQVTLTENPDEDFIDPATHPVFLRDFYITPEQTGLVDDSPPTYTTSSSTRYDDAARHSHLPGLEQIHQRRDCDDRRGPRMQPYPASPIYSNGPPTSRHPFYSRYPPPSGPKNSNNKRSALPKAKNSSRKTIETTPKENPGAPAESSTQSQAMETTE
jgi:hypothetical protein